MKPKIGDRVRITGIMHDDPNPRPVGAEGTVDWLGQWEPELTQQIGVKWDDGSRLILLAHDPFEVIGWVATGFPCEPRSEGEWISDIVNRTFERLRDNSHELSNLRLQLELLAKWAWDKPGLHDAARSLGRLSLDLTDLPGNLVRISDEAKGAK